MHFVARQEKALMQLEGQGQRSLQAALLRRVTECSASAYWAWFRQGLLQAASGAWEDAVQSLQHALRGDAAKLEAWEVGGA